MIKVPSTLFFLEAVISFSKAPHLTATQTSVLSGILFDGHFIPQNWSILEFQQSKLAASIAFVADIFCWILLKSHTLFFEHTSRFSALTSLKSVVSLLTVHRLEVLPHTCTQSFNKWRSGKKLVPKEAWTPMSQNWRGGEEEVGWAIILSRVSIKTSSLLVSWSYSKPVDQVRIYSYFLLLKKSFLNSQSGIKITPKMGLILLLTRVVFTLFGVTQEPIKWSLYLPYNPLESTLSRVDL